MSKTKFKLAMLPCLICATLATQPAFAQDSGECEDLQGTPPGLYVTTDEGETYIVQGDKMIQLSPGESGYAGENKLTCIKSTPSFLDWPCSTDAASSRKFKTYSIESLEGEGYSEAELAQEVVNRYFEIPEVIEPVPDWLESQYSLKLAYNDLVQFNSPEYWYHPNPNRPLLDDKRPKVLQISLYVGTHTVVVDSYMVDVLKKFYGDEPIPVVFVFSDSNVVPISYFGPNVSLEEVLKAFNERKIKVATVPMWQLGDYNLEPTAAEFQKLFDLPPTDSIDPLRREALAAELETFGFTRKPVFVTLLEGNSKMYIDDPERVAVAISMGMTRIPTVLTFVEQDSYLGRCGPGTPTGTSADGVSGESTPPGGAIVPPGGVMPPPQPEPEVSNS